VTTAPEEKNGANAVTRARENPPSRESADHYWRRIVFLVWGGVSLTSNFGVRNPAFPGPSCSEWENPSSRGFLKAHKQSRQESPRFRLSAAGGVKPPKATPVGRKKEEG
jgi:hypothetical protein